MNKFLIILLSICLVTCSEKDQDFKPAESNLVCDIFFVKGQFKTGNYTICTFVPTEVNYEYKYGKWKFWNLKGQLIAEVLYNPIKTVNDGYGGCPYEIINGVMDKKNGKFWDKNGNPITPSMALLKNLDFCATRIMDKRSISNSNENQFY